MRDPDNTKEIAGKHSPFGEEPTRDLRGSSSAENAAESPRLATTISALEQRYEILGEAGRGGMGVVYRARDRETNEFVALKVLKAEIAGDSAVIERFKDELKLARKVTHKNVCRIHEFNRASDGSAYISMEFVEGDSLRHVLGRFGGLPLRKGIQVAKQICAGLGEAHAQGVVHRDLKPENIMLDQAGNAKIMDFGIARSIEARATMTGGTIGTPAYMSPEQAEGKKADHRADIYSLGLILYEMFTGSPALTGQTPVEVALKQIHETPPAPRTLEPALPAHVEKAILKCLEKNPAKRFESARQLEAALSEQVEEKAAVAVGEEITIPARLAFWQRSDWYLFGSAVIGMILFFPLFYRFHPAPALKIIINAEEARQIAADAVKRLGWDAEVTEPDLRFWGEFYEEAWGSGSAYLDYVRSRFFVVGNWDGALKFHEGKYPIGNYGIASNGQLFVISRGLPTVPGYLATERPLDATLHEVARNALKSLFGPEAAVGDPKPFSGRGLRWTSPLGFGNFLEHFDAYLFEDKIATLYMWAAPSVVPAIDKNTLTFAARSWLVAPVLGLFTLILFLARRLFRLPRSRESLLLAGVLSLALVQIVAVAVWPLDSRPAPRAFLCVVVLPLVFCVSVLLGYAVLNTILYYLRNRFPAQAASYLVLFREHIVARGSGLALLRGIFAGLDLCGCWMVAISLGGRGGHVIPAVIAFLSPSIDFGSPYLNSFFTIWTQTGGKELVSLEPVIVRYFPWLLIGETFMVGWLLVTLPLSLLGKASARRPVLLAAVVALWASFGFSLAGPTVFPTFAYYLALVLQATFFGYLFLRYDFLTVFSAVFTVEVFLLAVPLYEIMQHVDPLPFAIPIGMWFALVLAASGLYFRPQLVASYRRVAAVFE